MFINLKYYISLGNKSNLWLLVNSSGIKAFRMCCNQLSCAINNSALQWAVSQTPFDYDLFLCLVFHSLHVLHDLTNEVYTKMLCCHGYAEIRVTPISHYTSPDHVTWPSALVSPASLVNLVLHSLSSFCLMLLFSCSPVNVFPSALRS